MTDITTCSEYRKHIYKDIEDHERRLNEYDEKLEDLKTSAVTHTVQIEELCNKIDNLVKSINTLVKVVIVPLFGGIVGFFFYTIQRKIIG